MIRNIQNIIWFKDILCQLAQYIKYGIVCIEVYVTQSLPGRLTCHDIVGQESTKEVFTKEETTKERVQDLDVTVSSNSSGLSYEYSSLGLSNINIYYRRPNVFSLIKQRVDETMMEDKSGTYKSLAVVGCGPDLFTGQMKEECQRNRWRKNSPDIYCYTENYS